jgi:hypothetical protein
MLRAKNGAYFISIVGRVVVQYQHLVVLIILLVDGGKQWNNVLRLIAGGYQDRYLICIMLAYARQFRVRKEIEQGYRKAQYQENKNNEQDYNHFMSISVWRNLLAS